MHFEHGVPVVNVSDATYKRKTHIVNFSEVSANH